LSAEKEVVNFWLNRKGYFTVNNLKSGNKDIGLLALRFEESKLTNVLHFEVNCSISGFSEQNYNVSKLIDEKFDDKNLIKAIREYTNKIDKDVEIESIVVLNSLPKDKKDLIEKFKKSSINVVEFEDVLSDVMKGMKTEYFKNDVIRTLQIVKFLLISNPKKLVNVLHNSLSQSKTREFLSELLNKDEIIKEFRKTNEDRLAMILKESMIKPEKLAKMLENDVLNRRTRKPFVESLMEQKKIGKVYKKEMEVKKEKPLSKFFG
jgi:hypothetical protein